MVETTNPPAGSNGIGRRSLHKLAAGMAVAGFAGRPALAADFPTRSLKIIVPFGPGGGTDLIARVVGKKLAELLGQNVLVENHGGGDTVIGTNLVATAKPDGYTLLLGSNTFALNPTLRKDLPFDSLKDFTPVAVVAIHPFVMVIHPSVKANNLQEFLALAKANPGALNFASAGMGTGNHLATELFIMKSGIKLTHVPYQGTGAFVPDLLAGRVQMSISVVAQMAPYIQSGALRALGVGELQRVPALPNVPTISEAGVPGYQAEEWNGFLVRSGTPPDIVAKLNAALMKSIEDPDVIKTFATAGADPKHTTPKEAQDFIANEVTKWREVITAAGIKVQ